MVDKTKHEGDGCWTYSASRTDVAIILKKYPSRNLSLQEYPLGRGPNTGRRSIDGDDLSKKYLNKFCLVRTIPTGPNQSKQQHQQDAREEQNNTARNHGDVNEDERQHKRPRNDNNDGRQPPPVPTGPQSSHQAKQPRMDSAPTELSATTQYPDNDHSTTPTEGTATIDIEDDTNNEPVIYRLAWNRNKITAKFLRTMQVRPGIFAIVQVIDDTDTIPQTNVFFANGFKLRKVTNKNQSNTSKR